MEHRSDQELLVEARRDAQAFVAFYERHVAAVHAYFRRRAAEPEAAFDLTAETFAAALHSLGNYRPGPEPARAWLFGIARNVLRDALRRGRVQDRARQALQMEPIVLDDGAVAWLQRIETAQPALQALAALAPEQRDAVAARHLDDEPYDAIAARLGCSQSVVRQRVSRGLKALRAQLKEAPDG